MALVGKTRVSCVKFCAFKPFGHKDIGDEITTGTDHRIIVAGGAGAGVRAAQPGERRIGTAFALGRDNGLRRFWTPRTIRRGELGPEQGFATINQGGQRGFPRFCHRIKIDMAGKCPLIPTCSVNGPGTQHKTCRQQRSKVQKFHRARSIALSIPGISWRCLSALSTNLRAQNSVQPPLFVNRGDSQVDVFFRQSMILACNSPLENCRLQPSKPLRAEPLLRAMLNRNEMFRAIVWDE